MTTTFHTVDSAPAAAQARLEGAQKSLGFVPNLFAVLADSPAALTAYQEISTHLANSELSPTEQQVVALAASRENNCTYCVAAHTTLAQMGNVDADVVTALRNGTPIADTKLEALRTFTNKVVNQRGDLSPADVEAFAAAGYSQKHALSVIVGVAMKVLSNYTNHLFSPDLDEAFAPNAWTK